MSSVLRLHLILSLLLTTTGAAWAADMSEVRAWLRQGGLAEPANGHIVICHGYGCKFRASLDVEAPWFTRVRAVMRKGRASPEAERRALAEAVPIYTSAIAAQIGGEPDAPKSPYSLSLAPGQTDCHDVSSNTTGLLLVLKEQGLLVHHNVERTATRGLFFDGRYPHTTAVMSQVVGGAAWALDPWARAPGEKPDILPLDQWKQEG